MSNVQWKEFNVGEFFEFKSVSPQVTKKDVDMMEEGEIPFIMQSSDNNGVVKYVAKQENEKFKLIDGNVITCFNHLNKVYYQSQSFYSKQGGNVFFITYEEINELNAKYIVGILNVFIKDVGYGQNTQTNFKKINMVLPVTPEGEPDWSYMEAYIRDKQEQVSLKLEQLTSIKETPKTLVYSALNRGVGVSSNVGWKEFKIGELVEIKVGKQPPIGNRHDTKEEGYINTVTGVTVNNGVGFYSKPYSDIYINELTMAKDGEYAGKVFLQRDEFCLGGHSLGLLMGSDVSNDSKLYLATLLNGLQSKGQWQNSTYINSVTLKELKEILIPLPVTAEGTPDWSYMESYIQDKQEQVKLRLDQLTSINETPKTLVYSALNRRG